MAIYRILTLDGGGIRGLLTAVLLERLEQEVPGWLDQVDLIGGTSTGGILALGLARGLTPTKLRQLYAEKCEIAFDQSWFDDLIDIDIGQVVHAKYKTSNLKKLIEAVVDDVTLGQLQKKVVISTFELYDKVNKVWEPKFFHNFPGSDDDSHEKAVDVALYTSAAPTYFPAYMGYIDGGVMANNPSMAALTQALDERTQIANKPTLDDIRLLSLGTGRPPNGIPMKNKKYLDWGFVQWGRYLLDIIMDGSMGTAHYQCKQLLGEAHYRRLNPVLVNSIGLDACDKTDELQDIGENHPIEDCVTWLKTAWI